MFKQLINECRSVFEDAEPPAPAQPEGEYNGVKLGKNDKASERVGYLLSTPLEDMSRKKMLKLVPHLDHHFTKGHGAGEGENGVVDMNDLSTLGRHAETISNQAHAIVRMPGPAHHLASTLCNHVADAHAKMSGAAEQDEDVEGASLHANEHGKFKHIAHQHRKVARRHGYY